MRLLLSRVVCRLSSSSGCFLSFLRCCLDIMDGEINKYLSFVEETPSSFLEEDRLFGPNTNTQKKRDFSHNVSLLGFHKRRRKNKNFGKK